MATFTIDTENNITAHVKAPETGDGVQPFSSAKELAKLAGTGPSPGWSRSDSSPRCPL